MKYKEGPLEGLKNGDRKFLVDFSATPGMGSYHLVDGAFVTVTYSGQRGTCGRCHGNSSTCPGGGIARVCEERGGVKVQIKTHMEKVWKDIGYTY